MSCGWLCILLMCTSFYHNHNPRMLHIQNMLNFKIDDFNSQQYFPLSKLQKCKTYLYFSISNFLQNILQNIYARLKMHCTFIIKQSQPGLVRLFNCIHTPEQNVSRSLSLSCESQQKALFHY